MIKRLIFDLDNTLIMWKDEYIEALKTTLDKYNNHEDANYINNLIDDYENFYDKYDKEIFKNYINSHIKEKINMNFINDFIYNMGFMSEEDKEVINTLEYLSKKYELVVLTNWFKDAQTNRLKNASIYKYFKEIYGGDYLLKPNKEAFINACDNYKPSECIMIGDDYIKDIEGAINCGIKPIYVNKNNKENKLDVTEVTHIKELIKIL